MFDAMFASMGEELVWFQRGHGKMRSRNRPGTPQTNGGDWSPAETGCISPTPGGTSARSISIALEAGNAPVPES
jgi:hypothetical protein